MSGIGKVCGKDYGRRDEEMLPGQIRGLSLQLDTGSGKRLRLDTP